MPTIGKDEYKQGIEDMVKDHERCIDEFKMNIAHIFKCFDEAHKRITALEKKQTKTKAHKPSPGSHA